MGGTGRRGAPHLAALLVLALSVFIVTHAHASPRSNYLLHCGGCHLENGGGTPPEVPDLRVDLDWIASSPEGRSYLTRVPGASQVPLSDEKLAEVLNWIFETYYPGRDDIRPFTGAEIARTRPQPLWDPIGARRELTAAPQREP